MNTVSIIVPVYNAGEYIEACLNSILQQTYQQFEVLLVDDGSGDASGSICDSYAGRDKRITVYHRENSGVSASRNFGLDHAQGKYILFVDADDTIEPDMLEGCIRLADKNTADLVICSFRYFMTDEDNRVVDNSLGTEACVTRKELFDQWFYTLAENEILNPPWNKFIRKDLLDTNRIRFNEKFSICEDMMFSVQLLNASKKTVLTGRMFYNYYLKSSGTLVFKFHENYYEALTRFYIFACEYCSTFENNSRQLKLIDSIYVNLIIAFLKQICIKAPWDRKTKYRKMNEIGRDEKFLRAIKNASLNRKRKLVCSLLKNRQVYLISFIYRVKSLRGIVTGMGGIHTKNEIKKSLKQREQISSAPNTNKIPKIIHYCWFGGKPIPERLQKCVDSWELLEDYKVMRWDESNCSFDENEFVRKTYQEKQLGYIGDYYRLKALYEYGGIYLDTDVKVYKSLDDLLNYNAFFNFIFDCSIGSAIIGAQPGNPLIKNLLDMYDATTFGRNASGKTFEWSGNQLIVNGYATSNYYYTYYILKHYPAFRLNNRFQDMGDFVIFPKEYFEIGTLTAKHYAIHLCSGEWRIKNDQSKSLKSRIKRIITKWPALYDMLQIIVRKHRYVKMKKDIPFYSCYLAQKEGRELPDL